MTAVPLSQQVDDDDSDNDDVDSPQPLDDGASQPSMLPNGIHNGKQLMDFCESITTAVYS